MRIKSRRNSNMEFLRIISMLFITLHHFSLWAQGGRSDAFMRQGHFASAFQALPFVPLGDIGVYIFVMITGFYMGAREVTIKRSLKKTLQVYLELYFYSLLFYLIAINMKWPMNNDPHNINILMPMNKQPNILQSLLPVTFNQYWFVTAYIVLMLLLPIINRGLQTLNKQQFGYLLLIMTITTSVFPLLNNNIVSESLGFGILLTAYLYGMFIREFLRPSKINILYGFLLFSINLIVIYVIMFYEFIGIKYRFTNIYTGFFALMAAIGLFLIFVNFKPNYNIVINQIAKHMFAVYLITENIFVVKQLWKYFKFREIHDLLTVNLYGFMTVIEIMAVCYFIDVIRSAIFMIVKYLIKLVMKGSHRKQYRHSLVR